MLPSLRKHDTQRNRVQAWNDENKESLLGGENLVRWRTREAAEFYRGKVSERGAALSTGNGCSCAHAVTWIRLKKTDAQCSLKK